MKKQLCLLILFTTFTLMISPCNAFAGNDITVYVNGTKVVFDVQPIVQNERTLVPMRAIFEALNMTVSWNENSQTITASTEWLYAVEIKLGSKTAITYFENYDNYDFNSGAGEIKKDNILIYPLEVPAQVINGRTLVPLRFIGECLNYEVNWNAANNTINIYTNSSFINDNNTQIENLSSESINDTVYNFVGRQVNELYELLGLYSDFATLGIWDGGWVIRFEAEDSPYYFTFAPENQEYIIYGTEEISCVIIGEAGVVINEEVTSGMTYQELRQSVKRGNCSKLEFDEFIDYYYVNIDYGYYTIQMLFDSTAENEPAVRSLVG